MNEKQQHFTDRANREYKKKMIKYNQNKKRVEKWMKINNVLCANDCFAPQYTYFTFNLHVANSTAFYDSLNISHLIVVRICSSSFIFFSPLLFLFISVYDECAAFSAFLLIFNASHLTFYLPDFYSDPHLWCATFASVVTVFGTDIGICDARQSVGGNCCHYR